MSVKDWSKKKKLAIFIPLVFILVVVLGFLSFIFYILGYNDHPKATYDVSTKAASDEITIMNFNVRCVSIDDVGDMSWFKRAPYVIEHIAKNEPDIICFQEVSQIHKGYFDEALKGYGYVLKYRNKGYAESTPIYYNKSKFDLVEDGGFWLSNTPKKQSKDWGSSTYRICTYVVLKEKSTGKQFAVFNTHLDHKSEEARINGIQVVLNKIEELGSIPAMLTGDMNDYINSPTIDFADINFDNSRLVALDTTSGPQKTWHDFGRESKNNTEIDFIFASKNDFIINQYRVLNEGLDIYPSDHYAVRVKFKLK